jgi:hypothetical protein
MQTRHAHGFGETEAADQGLTRRSESGRATFGQVDKWKICLRAAGGRRSDNRETSTSDALSGAVAAIMGERTRAEMTQQYDLDPNQITAWKAQVLDGWPTARATSIQPGRPAGLLNHRNAAFVTRLRSARLPGRSARQLPGSSDNFLGGSSLHL